MAAAFAGVLSLTAMIGRDGGEASGSDLDIAGARRERSATLNLEEVLVGARFLVSTCWPPSGSAPDR